MSDLAISAGAQMDPMSIAKVFRASGMFPDIQSESAAATKIIIGRGLGLSDYDAMSGLHIIKGKAVLAANLMAAAIKRAGKYDYRAMVTDEEARIEFRQRTADGGWETIGITSFTMEDAKRAGLGGDNWRKYPKAMLFARAISSGYKSHCPDALGAAPVYVEAHGETEIVDDAPAPKPVRQMTREERRADTEALLSPTPPAPKALPPAAPVEIPIDGGTDRVPVQPPDVVTLTPRSTTLSRAGTEWWRVDVAGEDRPYAIKDASVATNLEASIAFGATVDARFVMVGSKRVIVKVEDIGHG